MPYTRKSGDESPGSKRVGQGRAHLDLRLHHKLVHCKDDLSLLCVDVQCKEDPRVAPDLKMAQCTSRTSKISETAPAT